jgi:hypothetical protein
VSYAKLEFAGRPGTHTPAATARRLRAATPLDDISTGARYAATVVPAEPALLEGVPG